MNLEKIPPGGILLVGLSVALVIQLIRRKKILRYEKMPRWVVLLGFLCLVLAIIFHLQDTSSMTAGFLGLFSGFVIVCLLNFFAWVLENKRKEK